MTWRFLDWNIPDTRSRTSASVVEMGRWRVRYLWPAPYMGCWIRWLVALMRPLYNWKVKIKTVLSLHLLELTENICKITIKANANASIVFKRILTPWWDYGSVQTMFMFAALQFFKLSSLQHFPKQVYLCVHFYTLDLINTLKKKSQKIQKVY